VWRVLLFVDELAAFVSHMTRFAAVETNDRGDIRTVAHKVSRLAALVTLVQLVVPNLLAVPGEVPDLVAVVAHGRADKAGFDARRRTFRRTVAEDVPRLETVEARRLADELGAIAGDVTLAFAPITLVLRAVAGHVAAAVALETLVGVAGPVALFAAAGHVRVAADRAAAGVAAVPRQMSGAVAPVAHHGVAHGSSEYGRTDTRKLDARKLDVRKLDNENVERTAHNGRRQNEWPANGTNAFLEATD